MHLYLDASQTGKVQQFIEQGSHPFSGRDDPVEKMTAFLVQALVPGFLQKCGEAMYVAERRS